MGKDIRISNYLANHNAKQTAAVDVHPMDILQIIDSKLRVYWEPVVSVSRDAGEVVFHLATRSAYSVPPHSFVWIA